MDGEAVAEDGAAGDEAAFVAAMYRAHAAAVLRHLRGGFGFARADGQRGVFRVDSTFEAEELCHDAFVAFHRRCLDGGFDRARPALPYLLRIAAHLALRRGARGARAPVPVADEADLQVLHGPEALAPDPAEVGEARRLVGDFYAALDPEAQAVFDLCLRDDHSQAQAGAALGLSRDRIYRVLTAIKRGARRFFADRGWFDEP